MTPTGITTGPEAHRRAPRPPAGDSAGPHGLATPVRAVPQAQNRVLWVKVRPKCALRRIPERQPGHRESRHRSSEPVFSSRATHSTWCVIGNRSMGLSVSAILCGWLHPTEGGVRALVVLHRGLGLTHPPEHVGEPRVRLCGRLPRERVLKGGPCAGPLSGRQGRAPRCQQVVGVGCRHPLRVRGPPTRRRLTAHCGERVNWACGRPPEWAEWLLPRCCAPSSGLW